MKRVLILAAIGIVVGALLSGGLGAALGLLGGAAVGGLWVFFGILVKPQPAGRVFSPLATRRLICIPLGMPAECQLERNAATGRWTDVQSCSLCSPSDQVRCEKRCLRLMNDAHAT